MQNQDKWKKKIDDETKKYQNLEKIFYEIHKTETDTYKKRLAALQEMEALKALESEDNKNLSNIYTQFYKSMKEIEDKKLSHLNHVNNDLLPVTTYYYKDLLKQKKQKLETLLKLNKAKQDYQNENQKAKEKNDQQKISQTNQAIVENDKKEKQESEDFRTALCKFEADRTTDNKNLFLHYILSELDYHANALEKISNLFQTVNRIEPLENLEDFGRKMNIRINYKKIGVDMDAIKKRKEKREMEENNRRNIQNQKVFNE